MTRDRNAMAREAFRLARPQPNQGTVCVGVPSDDSVKANFAMAMAALTHYCGWAGIKLALTNQKGSVLPKNRNMLVETARELGCSHLLQIDSDLTFPPNALHRLILHNQAIVGCTYARRSQPHDNLAVPLNKQPVHNASGLTAVDRLPTGFLLVRMDVFDKIRQPWFRFPTIEATEALPAGRIDGEDYYFCDGARDAGYVVYLDVELSFEVTHWGEAGWRVKEDNGVPDAPRFEMVELQSAVR